MKRGLKAIIILLSIFSACGLRAETFIEPRIFIEQKLEIYGLAGVPWESEISLDQERARAWMDALHHAYDTILSLPLMEGKLVRHALQNNAALKDRLGPVLLGSPKVFYQTDASGLLRCRIDVPLSGKNSLRSALYLAAMRPLSQEPESFSPGWAAGVKIDEKAPAPPFRRLIIDVRSFDFAPSLFPRFFDSDGVMLFQESMIPNPHRFSRPAVRFVGDIKQASEDRTDEEVYIVAAKVNVLALRDITVEHSDADVFSRFCRELISNPSQERELVIVFDPAKVRKTGKLGKIEKKSEKSEKSK